QADRQDVFVIADVGVGFAVLHIWTEAADAGDDVFLIVRMLADDARQREELHGSVEIDLIGRNALRQARALGLHGLAILVFGRLTELQVAAEAARAHRDFQSSLRVFAELAHAAALAIGTD